MCKDLPDEYKAMLIDIANDMFDKQKDAAAWLGLTEYKMSRLMSKQKNTPTTKKTKPTKNK